MAIVSDILDGIKSVLESDCPSITTIETDYPTGAITDAQLPYAVIQPREIISSMWLNGSTVEYKRLFTIELFYERVNNAVRRSERGHSVAYDVLSEVPSAIAHNSRLGKVDNVNKAEYIYDDGSQYGSWANEIYRGTIFHIHVTYKELIRQQNS